jgi:hypothetical protein
MKDARRSVLINGADAQDVPGDQVAVRCDHVGDSVSHLLVEALDQCHGLVTDVLRSVLARCSLVARHAFQRAQPGRLSCGGTARTASGSTRVMTSMSGLQPSVP